MKLIEDLGVLDTGRTKKNGKPVRESFGMYECPICETPFKVRRTNEKSSHTTKCRSCQVIIKNTKHGDSKSKLFNIWVGIKQRCLNPNNKSYKNYGAKGVTISDIWINDYQSFKDWSIENGYKEGLSIDKDKLCEELKIYPKIYSPTTCLWMTQSENSIDMHNRKRSMSLYCEGKEC